MVVNKPAGLVVHPGSGNWQGTLLNALLHHAPQMADVPRAGIVHRLDKDTSGLMVVAKTLTAQTTLVRQMQARTVKREYLAIVHGVVRADGSVDAPLGRDPRNRLKMSVIPGGKEARTHYRTLERLTACGVLAGHRANPPDPCAHAVAGPSIGWRSGISRRTAVAGRHGEQHGA